MFISFFKGEFKRSFLRWRLVAGFLIFIGCFIHIYEMEAKDIVGNDISHINNSFILFSKAQGASLNSYIFLIIPLVILLLVGDSLALDRKTGFLKYYLTRISYRKYIIYKSISVSIIAFVVTFVFELVAFLYALIRFPLVFPKKIEEGITPTYGTDILLSSPFMYILLIIIITCFMSVAICSIALYISTKINNIYAVVTVPWLIYLIVSLGMYGLGGVLGGAVYKYAPMAMLGEYLHGFNNYNLLEVPLYWLSVFVISAIFTVYSFSEGFKKNIYQ